MADTTFAWRAQHGAARTVQPPVRVIKMGDGYEQRQTQGIARKPRRYTLLFREARERADAIDAFLTARGALESFNYTHPGDAAGVFVCREWTKTNTGQGVREISATFEEVFE